MRKVILIGGAPTTGKSTLASLMSERLSLPWISTDQIRELMRAVVDRDKFPKLFNPEGYDARRFLTEFSAEEIANMEMEQGEETWVGIRKFIEDDYTWGKGSIIEGVNILPHLVARDFKDDKEIKAIFLVDEDADRMKEVIYTRGLWDDAGTYPDDLKEKEVEWATLFSHKLKSEVEKYGFPYIEVQKMKMI
ncbi:MAG: hypothetical protein COV31_00465 [Candidatus Yanofskybacteria bacterium CG10_big_fil_rev_8_21_14_0_10_46_23]|uniref:NadR/Ttd14 AAA domain-containing protein n=1 Tax=Candidatus Yanofskybacteria bacterium CG10_big_fil_rev_8_21_14_0_10_46_23 TaxID=1975098 RepID=A0A2H0R4W8_9BACT|nr:MAG: hypothetical protein COV31_00465 [Candidatus Yanofskybacteria bacterium CG10_big_fil_rev_8_21_14_0_10_46_23]